jgi:hypothetical protein
LSAGYGAGSIAAKGATLEAMVAGESGHTVRHVLAMGREG